MLLRLCACLAAAVTVSLPLRAQSPAAVLDEAFAPWRSTSGPGCTVGLDLAGVRTLRAYGMSDLEDGIALRPGSILETGSVAKQFTAAVVVALAAEGRLSLDDDIRKHLPEVPDFGARITIRNLLQHTSGLRDQWALLSIQGFPPGQEVHTFDRILDLVAHQQRLNFAPGAEYLYSNTGYALTAIIVQRVTGKPFAQVSRELLFEPLGMMDTEWRYDYRRVVPGRAVAYDRGPDGWLQDMPFTMVHGNGGLLTTVADLLIWNRALTAGTIPGGAAAVRQLETRGRLNDGSEISYALGLSVGTFRGLRIVTHGGATAGYRTILFRIPERDFSIAVLCNAAQANPTGMAERVATRLLGLPAADGPPAPPVAITAAELARYTGVYRDSTVDQILTVGQVGDTLTLRFNTQTARMTYLGDGRFWADGPGEVRFERVGDHFEIVQFAEAWRRYQPMADVDRGSLRLEEYAGEYRSPELEVTYRVEPQSGGLAFLSRPSSRLILAPAYPDGFRGGPMSVRFVRNRRGQVTGLRVFAGRARDVYFERLPGARR